MTESPLTRLAYKVQFNLDDMHPALVDRLWLTKHWLLLSAISIPVGLLGFYPGDEMLRAFQLPFFFLGAFGLGVIYYRFFGLKAHAKNLLETPNFLEEQHVVVDTGGLSVEATKFRCSTEWSQFVRWDEGPAAFFLFTSHNMFFIIPKRCLAKSEIDQVRDLFSTHIKSTKTSKNKVIMAVGFFLLIFIVSFLSALFKQR
jgi:hypothetical protein